MLRKEELIQKFLDGATEGRASNLKIEGDTLINYYTPIAYRYKGFIILNSEKYSPTTSRNQNLIRRLAIPSRLLETDEENLRQLIHAQNQNKVFEEILKDNE